MTKGDLVDYYRRIAAVMLPHLARPAAVACSAFPTASATRASFRRTCSDYFPSWIDRARHRQGGRQRRPMSWPTMPRRWSIWPTRPASRCISGLSRTDRIDHPDRLIFDLDPSDDDFAKVQRAAAAARGAGGAGPRALRPDHRLARAARLGAARPRADFDRCATSPRARRAHLAARHPDAAAPSEQRKAKRAARGVFLD